MSPATVVRLRTFVVEFSRQAGIVSAAIGVFYGDMVAAANTFLGVQCLAVPEFLIEVEATAIAPD